MQEVINSTWRRETELKDLKAEHAAIDRKIQLSLKPVEQGDEKQDATGKEQINKYRNNHENEIVEYEKPYSKEELAKEIDEIKRLFVGKLGVKEFEEIVTQYHQTKYENENQYKGMKIGK